MDVGGAAVDTGFIVYNEATYPNFSALLEHLGVATKPTNMTFAVSLDNGRLEYSGTGLTGLFAQPRNAVSLRFWGMLRELLRFYREAPLAAEDMGDMSLDAYLDSCGYGTAFREDHLYPMAAAIWSTPAAEIGEYPARAFIRFCENHGLLKLTNRPLWRTLAGGSRAYVEKLAKAIPEIRTNTPIWLSAVIGTVWNRVSRRRGPGASIRSSWRHTPIRRSRCSPIRPPRRNGCLALLAIARTAPCSIPTQL